jgi:DNA-binding response OmpR family regulator
MTPDAVEKPIVVLLVDDQRFIGMAVTRLLGNEQDITLHCCYSANDAIAHANRITPQVILQDLQMPDIDGLTLVGLFRSNPATAITPVIVLSGNDDASSRAKAEAAGAADYLVKLPTKDVLVDRIRSHARGTDVSSARVDERPSVNDDVTLDSTVINGIRNTFSGGGPDLVAKLIDQFVKEASSLVDRLSQAATRGDAAALKAASHSLKGTSLTIGANRLARFSGDVETHITRQPGTVVDAALIRAIVEELDRVRAACAQEKQMTDVGAAR